MKNANSPNVQIVASLVAVGLASSMGCTEGETNAYVQGDRRISAVQIETQCAYALTKAASADPKNVGFPFQIPAEEEAKLVQSEVNKALAQQFGTNREGLRFGSETFHALYLSSRSLAQVQTSASVRVEQLSLALRLTERVAPSDAAPERRLASLARLSAVEQLYNLGALTKLEFRQHLAGCAECLQDPELFLRLYYMFEGSGNAVKAFASLESAILAEMRQSTNKHLPEFESAFKQAKSRALFRPEQNAYIQSLFERYTGVLE